MNRFRLPRQILAALALVLFLAAPLLAAAPRYVFFFIGDGMGVSQRQLSEYFLQEQTQDKTARLVMNSLAVAGLNTTFCADSLVTDSAAAGTALASGIKTKDGMIGKDPGGKDVKTILEAARDAGMKTGIITTTRLTHATPAAFAAHEMDRDSENEIAEDLLESRVDFLAGGGIRHFIPQDASFWDKDAAGHDIKSKRKDEKNLVQAFGDKGYATFTGMTGAGRFAATDFSKIDKAFAAFTTSHLPYEIERCNQHLGIPDLAALTRAGIAVLSREKKGFFLMVEGGRIDHACHVNDPTAMIYDTLALDQAIRTALDFYKAHPGETLILVATDHETGGLALGGDTLGYALNLSALTCAQVSVEDTLMFGPGQYQGDRNAFLVLLSRDFCLSDLTRTESVALTQAFDAADAGQTQGYYKMNPTGLTAARLLSQRANINWGATIHTATQVPLSAHGQGAAAFGGYKDNTQVARTLAKVMGLAL